MCTPSRLALFSACRRCIADWRQRPHDGARKAINEASSAIRDQGNLPRLARLEPYGGPRWNIEAIAQDSLAIECEGRVCFGEMIVTADLNRPIPGIGDLDRDSGLVLVEDDITCAWNNLAGNHASPPSRDNPMRAAHPPAVRTTAVPGKLLAQKPAPIPTKR